MTTSVTRAAEGFDRRAFTVQEILRMQEAGIISEDENFELIEGEIVPLQAKTHVHELIKSTLNLGLARALPDKLWLGVESTMYCRSSLSSNPTSSFILGASSLRTSRAPIFCSPSRSR